jgi:hypothetical protein
MGAASEISQANLSCVAGAFPAAASLSAISSAIALKVLAALAAAAARSA